MSVLQCSKLLCACSITYLRKLWTCRSSSAKLLHPMCQNSPVLFSSFLRASVRSKIMSVYNSYCDMIIDIDQVLFLGSLTRIVPLYPTLVRAYFGPLSEVSMAFLLNSSNAPSSKKLLRAASDLHAVLHFTGGKTGAGALWRKLLEDLITLALGSLHGLRTTVMRGRTQTLSRLDRGILNRYSRKSQLWS